MTPQSSGPPVVLENKGARVSVFPQGPGGIRFEIAAPSAPAATGRIEAGTVTRFQLDAAGSSTTCEVGQETNGMIPVRIVDSGTVVSLTIHADRARALGQMAVKGKPTQADLEQAITPFSAYQQFTEKASRNPLLNALAAASISKAHPLASSLYSTAVFLNPKGVASSSRALAPPESTGDDDLSCVELVRIAIDLSGYSGPVVIIGAIYAYLLCIALTAIS